MRDIMNKITSTIDLQYMRSEFTKEDVLRIVGESRMRRLKEQYRNPDIRMFVIAHEGFAEGMSGIRKRILLYMKQTVQRVADAIGIGIPAYFQHDKGRERDQIGEVVGRKFVNDKHMSYTVAAILVYPDWKELDLDVASMEAEIEIKGEEVYNVRNVSAIALSNSHIDSPGFPHAKLVAAFEYFTSTNTGSGAETFTSTSGDPTNTGAKPERPKTMNLNDIKQWLTDNKIRVTDVFELDEIMQNPEVDKVVKRELQTKHEHARRVEDKLKRVEEEKNKELDNLLEQVKEYRGKIVEASSVSTLATALNKIEDVKMRGYVEQRAKERIAGKIDGIDDPSKVEEFVQQSVDEVVKDLETMKEILGLTETNPLKGDRKPPVNLKEPAGASEDDDNVNPLIPDEYR